MEQISRTAAFIAIKFYGLTLSEPYRSLFDLDTIRFYDQEVRQLQPPLNRYHPLLKKASLRKLLAAINEGLLPGDLMHVLMRKFYMDKRVNALRDRGYEQLLVLGGGLDHQASLNSAKGMRCLEVDLPSTIRWKRDFLQSRGYANRRLRLAPISSSGDLTVQLSENRDLIRPSRKTVVVAEGFFDYLTPSQFQHTLQELSSFFKNDWSLLSTVFSLPELPWYRRLIYKGAVRAAGEQLRLHYSLTEMTDALSRNRMEPSILIYGNNMLREQLGNRNINRSILPGFYLLQAENRSTPLYTFWEQ